MKNKVHNNKEKENISRSAVTAQPDMLMQRTPMFGGGVIQYLLINVLIISSMLSGLSYIDVLPNYPVIFLYCAVLTALFCFPKKKYAAIGMIAVTGFAVYRMWEQVMGGVAVLILKYMKLFGFTDKGIASFITVESDDFQATLALLVYGALMSLVLYESVFVHKNLVITFIITFILPEIGLYNGNVPSYLPTFALLISWICVFAMQLSDYRINHKDPEASFTKAKRKEVYYLTGNGLKTSAFAQLSLQICLFTAAAIIVSIMATSLSGHERSENIDILRKNLANDFSYESFVEAINQMKGGFKIKLRSKKSDWGAARYSGGLSMGKLGDAHDLKFTGKTLLELTYTSQFAIDQPLYIRGYAAGDYKNGQWSVNERDWGKYIISNVWNSVNNSAMKDYQDDIMLEAITQYGILNQPYHNSDLMEYGYSQGTEQILHIKDLSESGLFFTPYFGTFFASYGTEEDYEIYTGNDAEPVGCDYATIGGNEYNTSFLYFGSPVLEYEQLGHYAFGSSHALDPAIYCLVRTALAQEMIEGTVVINNISIDEDYCAVIDQSPLVTNNICGFSKGTLLEKVCMYVDDYNQSSGDNTMYITRAKSEEDGSLDEMFDIIVLYDNSFEEVVISPSEFLNIALDTYLEDLSLNSELRLTDSDIIYNKDLSDTVYADYVFTHYLDVAIDINPDVINYINSNLYTMGNEYSTNYYNYAENVISLLNSYFESNYTYSLSVEKTPDDQDFIEYFLNEMDAGSCTYFSSAAVEVLRYYGIPARYAEGFMVPGGNSKRSKDDENTFTIDVTDKYAHAWVEVYYPGVGWMPIEFTLSDPNEINDPLATVSTTEPQVTTTTPEVTTPAETTTAPSEEKVTTTTAESSPAAEVTTSKKGGGISAATMKSIAKAAVVVIVLGVIVLGYMLLRSSAKKSIEESICGSDENENCVNLYNLILRYLACISVTCRDNISDKERCKKICDQLMDKEEPYDIRDALTAACALAVEAEMGRVTFTEDDIRSTRELLKNVKTQCYEKMTSMQRFKAKYILALY